MKLFGVLILCATICCIQCEEYTKEKALVIASACRESEGATDADVAAMFKHEPAGSKQAKCLRACVMKRAETMTADGKLNREGMLKFSKLITQGDAAKEKLAEEVIVACEGIKVSDDHCEAAEEYSVCMKKHAAEKGLKTELTL